MSIYTLKHVLSRFIIIVTILFYVLTLNFLACNSQVRTLKMQALTKGYV